jgi:hypothetical protein
VKSQKQNPSFFYLQVQYVHTCTYSNACSFSRLLGWHAGGGWQTKYDQIRSATCFFRVDGMIGREESRFSAIEGN